MPYRLAGVGKQTIPCYRLSRRERDNGGNARERVIIALPIVAIAVANRVGVIPQMLVLGSRQFPVID